ncbi:MAG: SMC-Scp complex subunit ScpB [Microscillaceae bacterium]|nr:SMC-Scp complex subunit ScpB [Microscillaceae bacterium]
MHLYLEATVEALIFCAQEPLSLSEIRACLRESLEREFFTEELLPVLEGLCRKYESAIYPFQVYALAGGYQFLSKPTHHKTIGTLLRQKSKKKLSKAALETLAIIAYRQPITKGEIENIRGVASDYALQKLLDKELIVIKGKAEQAGRPILYGTSAKFMEHFGLASLDDLPQLKDFAEPAPGPMEAVAAP